MRDIFLGSDTVCAGNGKCIPFREKDAKTIILSDIPDNVLVQNVLYTLHLSRNVPALKFTKPIRFVTI